MRIADATNIAGTATDPARTGTDPARTAHVTDTPRTATDPGRAAAYPRPLPYRTAFATRLPFADATDLVRGQLRSWLRSKRLDVDRFDARETGIGQGATLSYVSTNATSGWQLRERAQDGFTWVSTVAVVRGDHQDASWVSLSVDATSAAGAAPTPDPPRLIRLLLDTLDAYDGEAILASHPILVAEPQVETLLEVVCAEDRRLPVVVAAPPADVDFERWHAVVADITQDLPGLASIYLPNPAAAGAFNDGIGPTHGVEPGAVRTYLPDVDPAITEDAVRHRVLGRHRIESEPHRARRALAALPRQLAATSLPPRAAQGLDLSLRDFTRDRGDTAVGDLATVQEQVKLLDELLHLAEDTERQLKATVSQLQDELFDTASELEVVRDALERRDDTIRALRRRLVDVDRYADAYTPPEEYTELPKSFADLLDRLGELGPFVVFTGDRDVCLDLDDRPQNSTWAQTAWQGLLALRDYTQTKQRPGFDGNFKRWCEAPVGGGRVVAPGKVALGESDTVRKNRRLALMRTFAVPVEIDPAGRIFMPAHLRLGQSSTVAPRLHFHDASAGHHRVFVGYIGRHLENTLTS